jgi:hypothetical protein
MRDQHRRAPGFRVFKHRQPSSLSEPSMSASLHQRLSDGVGHGDVSEASGVSASRIAWTISSSRN